jgi:mono/diheme cytochrome c family protein
MKFAKFFLILTAVLAWSIIPNWAQGAAKTSKAEKSTAVISDQLNTPNPGRTNDGLTQLCQMGGGMMQGQGYCPGMGGGPGYRQGTGGTGSGADLFAGYCAGCHPGGGNNIIPDLPLRGSAQLKDFNTFRVYVRYPTLPNGARGPMPSFSSRQISDQQMRKLYQYLKSRWGN